MLDQELNHQLSLFLLFNACHINATTARIGPSYMIDLVNILPNCQVMRIQVWLCNTLQTKFQPHYIGDIDYIRAVLLQAVDFAQTTPANITTASLPLTLASHSHYIHVSWLRVVRADVSGRRSPRVCFFLSPDMVGYLYLTLNLKKSCDCFFCWLIKCTKLEEKKNTAVRAKNRLNKNLCE